MAIKQTVQMLVILAIYLSAVGVMVAGIATQSWLVLDGISRKGLFRQCITVPLFDITDCFDLWDRHTDIESAALGVIWAATGAAALAGLTFVIVPLSAGLQILAGLLQIGGSLTYVPLISLIEEYGFSFYLSLAGGGLLVVSGIAYAVIARINRYGLKPVLPWRNKKKTDKGMDDMDQGTEDDNTCDEAACQDNRTICDNCKDEI